MRDMNLRALETWFERALETPESERSDVLRSAPEELQGPLARMLGSVASAEAVLESPRWAVAEPDARAEPASDADLLTPGTRAGGFTIQELLGRGGMGAVYRAVQDRPNREIALKVLAAPLATARARRRFEREAEMLARLNHPGIVPIYEAGVLDAEHGYAPYFAMELVRGVPLGEWARASEEGIRPSLVARLDLLASVCGAVEHAHQRGVLHRDLKPANIIVGDDGRPRVLDFGVARLLGPDLSDDEGTLAWDVAGTPTYMSPEQLLVGAADTRSDVYALGVIAWEVLGGSFPFGAPPRSFEQALALARGERPPATSGTPMRPDVRAVLLKALDREPELRYRGAGELGDDLRRLKNGFPVSARPATPVYLASRWVLRHPWQAGLAGASVLAMLILGGLALAGDLQARHETRERLKAVELAQKRLDAQRDFIVHSLVRTAYTLQGIPGGHKAHADLLRDALPRLEALAAEAGTDLDLTCDLSEAMVSLAQSAGGLGTPNTGEPSLAERLSARALEMAEAAVRTAPASPRPLRSLEKAVSGAAELPSGVAHRRELYGRSVLILRQVYEMDGRQPEDGFRLAYRLMTYGSLIGDRAPIEEAVSCYTQLLAHEPDNWEYQAACGTALGVLAREFAEPEPALSLEQAERAEALLVAAHEAQPGNYSCARHLAVTRVIRANALAHLGRMSQTRSALDAALEILAASANDPTNTLHVSDRAITCTNVMLTVATALKTPAITDDERRALMELGLRAYALARLPPGSNAPEPPITLQPALRRADELGAAWKEQCQDSPGR